MIVYNFHKYNYNSIKICICYILETFYFTFYDRITGLKMYFFLSDWLFGVRI